MLVAFYFFLVGIRAMGLGFRLLGEESVQGFFTMTDNPFAGLAVGILATSLVQSSSVTTSMVVALVASPVAPLPVHNAIPMVLGANIGTTVTNTIVSLAHAGRPREFRRAMAFGTIDDFFNLVALALFLPIEIAFGVLEKASAVVTGWIPRTGGTRLPNPVKGAVNVLLKPLEGVLVDLGGSRFAGIAMLAFAAVVIFVTLMVLVRQLRKLSASRLRSAIRNALHKRPIRAFSIGMVATAAVQSSSIVLSLIVPLAGSGLVTLRQAFPVALGANVGTTLTALLAAMAVPREMLQFALQIALVHLLFNASATLVIYGIKRLRKIPLWLSEWIARTAVRSKPKAFLYVALLFYGLPGMLVLLREL